MAASEEISSTFADVDTTCIVTTPADVPPPPTFALPPEAETLPVASTLDTPAQIAAPAAPETVWGLSSRDCLLLFTLAVSCLGLSIWHWGQLSGWGLNPVEVDRLPERVYDYRLDINEATYAEWMQLPGIGKALAQRIIQHREDHGPFESIEELDEIKGIGPKTVEKLRPWLIVRQAAAKPALPGPEEPRGP